jgi:hypothetical protein
VIIIAEYDISPNRIVLKFDFLGPAAQINQISANFRPAIVHLFHRPYTKTNDPTPRNTNTCMMVDRRRPQGMVVASAIGTT